MFVSLLCISFFVCSHAPVVQVANVIVSLCDARMGAGGMTLSQSPEPDDPQDAVVAGQYKSDRAAFRQQAKYWTEHDMRMARVIR